MAYTNEQLGKALEDLTAAYNNFIEKAKEAAIAAMGDTVIAQIKQDAKDYIAAELAEQKAALEQAIEQAKIALKNSSDEAHVKLQQFSEEKQQELSALVEESKEALTLLAEQKFENLKTLADAGEKRLKDVAVEMEANMEETAKEAKEKVIKEFSNISETAVTETKEELKNQRIEFERKLSNQVDEFKSLSITEGNKIKELIREKIIEWAHQYKELYKDARFIGLGNTPFLKNILKVKLDEKNGTLLLAVSGSLNSFYDYNNTNVLVYVCNPEDDAPLRGLSVDVPLGQEDDILPYKNFSNYWSNNYFLKNFICINYDEKDILKDAEGYVHLKTVIDDYSFFANTIIRGFIIARRQTNLTYINVGSLNNDILEGTYNLIKEKNIVYTIFKNNNIIKIPYIHANDIIVGFHLTERLTEEQKERIERGVIQIKGKYTDYSHPIIHRPIFEEPWLPNEPHPTIKEPLCNYYKLLKSQNKDEEYFYIEMKRAEVLANTEVKNSFKFICLKIVCDIYEISKFKFRGFFTDDNEEGDLYIYDKEVLPNFLKRKVMHLPAREGDNYNYKILNALPFMERGKNYTVAANFKVLNGTATKFATILFYDFTKSEVLARSETPVVNGKCKAFLKFKYDYPVGHNVGILFYSGYCGYTQGIESEYKNFSLAEHVY